MVAMLSSKFGQQQNLLTAYTKTYGAALQRSQSLVALRAARVDAELAYRARGAFLASMNHELRTPLNAITGFAGLLRHAEDGAMEKEKRDEYLDYILQSAELLLSHLDMIIQIADAESGGAKVAPRAFAVQDVISQVVESRSEQIICDAPNDLPVVEADPDKIAVAFEHLLNFLSARSDANSVVKVTIRAGLAGRSAGHVYVSIVSQGVRIDDAKVQKTLRIFEQVHEGLDRRFCAEDVGLPIAKSFVELSHGKFSVKTVEGHDTVIRFALPQASEDHQRALAQLVS